MRLAWLTDIHLNFVGGDDRARLWDSVRQQADAAAISGDIAENPTIGRYLDEMDRTLEMSIYFVLGNHDFYRGSIAQTRAAVGEIARQSQRLVYLTQAGVVALTPDTAIIGHDGWADARLGDFERSQVILNDYLLIEELSQRWKLGWDKLALQKTLNKLGDEAARCMSRVLEAAFARFRRVILLTHVPPFREAAWYEGRLSDDEWVPHFASKAAGDALRAVMNSRPDCDLLVLCGHTHGSGEIQISSNLHVLTGEAKYRFPAVQRVLDVP